jgi:hypothetical protein
VTHGIAMLAIDERLGGSDESAALSRYASKRIQAAIARS